MTMQLKLANNRSMVLISAYAPTLMSTDEEKESFYEQLNTTLSSVPYKYRLVLLGNFNARTGCDSAIWNKVLGRHSIGKENANGTLLLQTCAAHSLAITNTFFQLANKYKTTWQHPRSKHWHLLDYVITRQRDLSDFHITCVMRGASCWSDHRLVRSVLSLKLAAPRRRQAVRRKKLDVLKLKAEEFQQQLRENLDAQLASSTPESNSAEEQWSTLKEITYKTASEVLGFATTVHKDWFDDQDAEARSLLDDMHSTHLAWINDKTNTAKKSAYTRARSCAQAKLCKMKNDWWQRKAEMLQSAADRHDLKIFYNELKAVYGPVKPCSTPVRDMDGTLLTDKAHILKCWADHFQTVLNQPSHFDDHVLDELPSWPVDEGLDAAPTLDEVRKSVGQMSSGKAPGTDGIPAEVLKNGGSCLTELFCSIWKEEAVPQDFKDALIVHLYKRKGDRACCDNHRGISLLSIAGKVLARVLLNRLSHHVYSNDIIPESQSGFRTSRGTMDMIFTARQLQEKCREQHRDMYTIFVDLTKAFDTVSRRGLWMVLRRIGCPEKFVKIIQSFHDGMQGQVIDEGELSEVFGISNGTKQGCVLAALLFSIFFAMMLLVAFKNCDTGIPVQFRPDGSVFNLRRLQAHTKILSAVIRDLLYADDCALVAHSLNDAQHLFDRFREAASRFGLTVSLKKTEVMLQPSPDTAYIPPVIQAGDVTLKAVDKFCYLGSILANTTNSESDITARLSKASSAFGRLTKRLWDDHGIRLDTKVAVYKAAVLTVLLYGCETWVLYRRHVAKLDQFHMRCLRRIAHVKWQDMVPNTEVLDRCNISGIEAFLLTAQLRWSGHVSRMGDTRLPKIVFYGQLAQGTRSLGGQYKRYKDVLKTTLKACSITPTDFESRAAERTSWRSLCKKGIQDFEARRVLALQEKRSRRKLGTTATTDEFRCDICGRDCKSRIGLHSHRRRHP